ncbi:probable malonyl-CoA-acyl carrier protein transacylase, mitochondrial [Plodia interpunctella]|uniref:probable malonyl-CoA-acyl carrier protein transacylase, mitochondrial n=1 Tax=Plodia interpunctella TaxID=58824 RepID=UPI002367CD5E|nr:probable malonyl-CoA-acyl carrier protein transacylase, mitochondrial [Plodia interpunctella]
MSIHRILCRACFIRTIFPKNKVRCKGSNFQGESPLKNLLNDASSFGEGQQREPALEWATQPYAARPGSGGDETEHRTPSQETTVLLFPGQGSQRVGMGRLLADIPAARELYDLASSVVGWNVWRVCTEGPAEELARRCQTAVVVTSLAALERARELRPSAVERVRGAAGFSLGELAALVFARALPLERALQLLELRTAAMRAAAQERPGGMLTVWLAADARLPLALKAAQEHATECGVVDPVAQIANYLYPNCKVVAGDEAALKWLESNGSKFGIRRCARVEAEGAFHTPLMHKAQLALREALQSIEVSRPLVPVVSCVDARAHGAAADVRRTLARHVARPVRWEQALHALYARPRGEHFPLTLALGPGAALRSTLRQVNARAWDCSVQIDV